MVNFQPTGPFILFGWSAAGKLIFELTRVLELCGREVSDIILSDSSFEKEQKLDDEGYEEECKGFIAQVEKLLEQLGVEFLKEKVRKKVKKYFHYYRNVNTLEVINANLHLIISEETQERESVNLQCWDEFTTKPVMIYNGFGRHENMVSPGALEKNAELIRKILDRIESETSIKN
jgi:thioesterase domain-containing protein